MPLFKQSKRKRAQRAKGKAIAKVEKSPAAVKGLPIVIGAAVAALAAFKFIRGRGGAQPA